MMNNAQRSHRGYAWISALLAGVLGMSIALPVFAADTVTRLSPAVWSSPPLLADHVDNALASRVTDVHAVPSKALVYVHTQQDIPNTTGKTQNSWYLDTLKAYSVATGKLQWSYSLHKPAGAYTLSTQTAYTHYGTVYLYAEYSDGTYKLYSIHASGKLNWEKSLSKAATITLMKDSSLLVASRGTVNSEGVIRSTLTRYDNNGKLLNQQSIQGSLLKAEGNRILIAASKLNKNQNGWEMVSNPRMDVYGLELKRLYSYQFPAHANIYGDGSDSMFVLNDGTVLIRANIQDVGNKLFGFDAKGKLLWGRMIPGDSLTQSTGTGYVVYENKTLQLYNTSSGKALASVTLEGDPDDYTWLLRTSDGNLMINLADRTYVIYPTTLAIVETIDTTNLGSPLDYVHRTVYSVRDDMLYKYVLKK
ncbi:PQQ-binding-like beta-propeller repeat protein [Paenibacillus sp. SGZ-1009]|uniref:outer membrane protein assembly factor BamB family protein n=1 Tax=Paenibacillus campi TaxID=3106031 RepID=UPI002AFF9214|nr:PQQ-binding-like beta-propeller repeat protein [Paenibacillus sp. SGZ-1009]